MWPVGSYNASAGTSPEPGDTICTVVNKYIQRATINLKLTKTNNETTDFFPALTC